MIGIQQLSMSYGSKLLFFDVNLTLNDNTRYALLGANGAGKSTFFRLLSGEEEASNGEVSIPKQARIGFLRQDQFRYEHTKIVDVVIHGKPELAAALKERDALLESGEWNDEIVEKLSLAEEIISHHNGYSANAFAEKLLLGLGITAEYHYEPLNKLSGGFKLRVLLAQALFEEPDILLLDEPTNHLDIITIQWLEKYLKNEFSGTLVFISHDVEFVSRLADKILDVDYGEIREYSGKYEKFLEEKKIIEEQKLALKKNAEEKIAEMQKFVDRFKAQASKARQAQSRIKMIEKIEIPDIEHSSRIAPHFHFSLVRPSGKVVLSLQHLSKAYDEKKLFTDLNFNLLRGEKLAILGENGVGKSTLLKILVGQIPADEGSFEWGHECHYSYFSQDHHEQLHENKTAFEWLREATPGHNEQTVRKALGQMLFVKEEMEKSILSLSGGEAARLLLAKMSLDPANILILDEPTNHLDLESTDALAQALSVYPGTVITISHNRHFVNQVANRILFIRHKQKPIDFRGKLSEL